MPLFAETNASEFGIVLLTIVNAVGGAFTFWVKAKYDARFAAMENDLKGCVEKHAAAEKKQETAEHAAAVALAEAARLKNQNGEQQGMIDTLAGRIVALVDALHRQGIPTGTATHAKLDDTGEHDPLPTKD